MTLSIVRLGTAFLCFATACSLAAGCGSDSKPSATEDAGGGSGGGSGSGGKSATQDAGPLPPTLTNVYRKVIIANDCQGAQCHGAKQGGHLDMSTKAAAYQNLVGKPADGPCDGTPGEVCGCGTSGKTRVVAGKPEESLIIEKLTGSPTCGERMPPTGEPVPEDQLDLVKRWIAAGAPDN